MKTVGKNKITVGFVIQTFNNNNQCIEQEFVAGDTVDYEDVNGNTIEPWDEYQPFDMVQPPIVELLKAEIVSLKEELATYEAEDYDRQIGGE